MINKQLSQPKILLESTIICSWERKHFDFLAGVDTNALSLHMLCLCALVETDQPIANSATFPSQKGDVTPFQLKWPME